MLQLRVIRAFKSNLEDLEDRRSIHSLRSLRNAQTTQAPALSSFFHQNRALISKAASQQSSPTSPLAHFSIAVPTSLHSAPLNINNANINARYMDDDGPPSLDDRSNANGQSKETRI